MTIIGLAPANSLLAGSSHLGDITCGPLNTLAPLFNSTGGILLHIKYLHRTASVLAVIINNPI